MATIHFILVVSKQGRVRLERYYNSAGAYAPTLSERRKIVQNVCRLLTDRPVPTSSILQEFLVPRQPMSPMSGMSGMNGMSGMSDKKSGHAQMCNCQLVYKRYASLFFVACIDQEENELVVLETIHHFVETLDRYFGNVCELDLIFNFHKAHFILDEILSGGEVIETSKRQILRLMATEDVLTEDAPSDSTNQGTKRTVKTL